MFKRLEKFKISKTRKMFGLIMLCILFTCLGTRVVQGQMSYNNKLNHPSEIIPLLLNSGAGSSKKAEVSIIIWFENGNISKKIINEKPRSDWTWDYKELETEGGSKAITLSGHCEVDKNEETSLYTWYTKIVQELANTGGRVYFDERIPKAIDISAYLSRINALPSQWELSGNTISIAAYQRNIRTNVMAGNDRVNIQLLSRGKNAKGRTVLAMPVLLEEF